VLVVVSRLFPRKGIDLLAKVRDAGVRGEGS
jgi:hypothetical protein